MIAVCGAHNAFDVHQGGADGGGDAGQGHFVVLKLPIPADNAGNARCPLAL